MLQNQFSEIIQLIQLARNNALRTVNTELINLYWQIGEYISIKVKNAVWGDKMVDELASYIQREHPELKGFNKRGLYRMKQFYETYVSARFVSLLSEKTQITDNQLNEIVSPVVTQLETLLINLTFRKMN